MNPPQITALVVAGIILFPVLIYFCSKAATIGVLSARKLFSKQNDKNQPN